MQNKKYSQKLAWQFQLLNATFDSAKTGMKIFGFLPVFNEIADVLIINSF
jgi:hypothetical protein